MSSSLHYPVVTAAGTFACTIDGAPGRPWVVFGNSLFTDHTLWDAQVEVLSATHRTLRFDQRGHGATNVEPGPYGFDTLATDVLTLMDELQIKRAHYVGISMGGNAGVAAASRQPHRFATLMICDARPWSPAESSKVWPARAEQVARFGLEPMIDATLSRWFDTTSVGPEPRFGRMRTMMRRTRAPGFVDAAALLSSYDLRSAYEALTVPTTLVAGDRDGDTPQLLEALARDRDDRKFRLILDAGHISNVDQPDQFNSVLVEHLTAMRGLAPDAIDRL